MTAVTEAQATDQALEVARDGAPSLDVLVLAWVHASDGVRAAREVQTALEGMLRAAVVACGKLSLRTAIDGHAVAVRLDRQTVRHCACCRSHLVLCERLAAGEPVVEVEVEVDRRVVVDAGGLRRALADAERAARMEGEA